MPERAEAPASRFALDLLAALVARGLRQMVVAPGSRSQALALAAAELDRQGAVQLHVRIDERSAGFLALGIALESGEPAAVITTSGTAVANLHPAVLEAHHARVPMILLTADRPDELRGIRSNQTTVQPGIFAAAERWAIDEPAPETGAAGGRSAARALELALTAWTRARGEGLAAGAGPVHLNLAFRDPLSSPFARGEAAAVLEQMRAATAPSERPSPAGPSPSPAGSLSPALTPIPRGPRTIVVAGAGAGPQAEEIARAGGWPLLAEVTSGARFGPYLVVPARELLDAEDFGGRVERVIVFGHPTLTRQVPALLRRDGVEGIVVAPDGVELFDPGRRARRVAAVTVDDDGPPFDREWLGAWISTGRALVAEAEAGQEPPPPDLDAARAAGGGDRRAFLEGELAALRAPLTRTLLVQQVWRATWPHDRLVLAASRLIREADRVVPGRRIRVHANRGLAGIDGTVSTGIGVAAALADQERRLPGRTRVLLGDLALLHDAGGLLIPPGEASPAVQLIVGNDGGGSIFDGLEVAASAPASAFDRVLYTPQRVDLGALAAAYGWVYQRAANRGELETALLNPDRAPTLIEVPLDR